LGSMAKRLSQCIDVDWALLYSHGWHTAFAWMKKVLRHYGGDRTPLSLNYSGITPDQRERRDEGNYMPISRDPVKANCE
jgi:hypothetical protein